MGISEFRNLPIFEDDRGALIVAGEMSSAIPFRIARVFWVTMEPWAIRGGHYHEKCKQAIIALNGPVVVTLDRMGFFLDHPSQVVIADPLKCIQYQNLSDEKAIVLVLCSEPYDPEDVFPC